MSSNVDQLTRKYELVGQSPKLHQVSRLIGKLAIRRCSVLILGESGTGKEIVAKSIYNRNPAGNFVTIDCSSLVGPLMESELFGHMKGSFTGAVNSKIGLLELANTGTAFFDEIGELPLELQAKLLRVLQEKEFRPVGSLSTRRSDFRLIAATNKNLEDEVRSGRFRKDLYYRLKVVSLQLAPLRERREDIPALIAHFLNRYGDGHVLTQACKDAFLQYDWPGNVRELEHAIEGMTAISEGILLDLPDLPKSIFEYVQEQDSPSNHEASPDFPGTLIELEKKTIRKALQFTKGDRLAASVLLGIGRATLFRKLREYNIVEESNAKVRGQEAGLTP